MAKKNKRSDEGRVVDEDSVSLNSCQGCESSDDDETKIADGELKVADFHMYDSKKKNKK